MSDRATRIKANILDTLDAEQNPATEEKQDDIISAIGTMGGGATSLNEGRKVVSVENTAVVLGSGACKAVFVTALTSNTDVVVIGGSGVIYDSGTRTGKILYPGDSITINIDNLSKIYINGKANEGVTFSYTN